MKKKNILYITVPYHAGVVEVAGQWVPLYHVTLAGATRAAGYPSVIYDAMTKKADIAEIAHRINIEKPDVVAVSMMTCTAPDGLKVLETAKEINPEIITIAGGIHASFMHEELFSLSSALDYVIIGEGEETMVELLNALSSKTSLHDVRGIAFREAGHIVQTGARPFLKCLDRRPMAWDLLDWNDYTYFILPGSRLGAIDTSRGCMHSCTFCSQQKFWQQTWRARSPEDLVREIGELNKIYGVDVILLTDDYPTPDRRRWERFLDLLIESGSTVRLLMETRACDIIRDRDILWKYRKAGIIHIYVGTEATSQSTLDLMKKDLTVQEGMEALRLCRDHNIITETSMIIGLPDDTNSTIDQTIGLLQEMNPDFAHFLAISPWPYADITKELTPYIEEHDYRRYNLIDPIVKPKNMTMDDVNQAILNGYRRFYMKKFQEIIRIDDVFKREYILTAIKRIMNHSFIRKKLGNLDQKIPAEVKAAIESLG